MSVSVFINLQSAAPDHKSIELERSVAALRDAEPNELLHARDLELFRAIQGTPFAYWAPREVFATFRGSKTIQSDGRDAQSGASTMDDFRFLRMHTEVPSKSIGSTRHETTVGKRWVRLAKGGTHSRHYIDFDLVVDWVDDGRILKGVVANYRGDRGWGYNWSAALNGHSFYFRPGN